MNTINSKVTVTLVFEAFLPEDKILEYVRGVLCGGTLEQQDGAWARMKTFKIEGDA